MKIKTIQCPLCCQELPAEIFLHHMAADHDMRADTLQNLNDRFKAIGFPSIEIYEKEEETEGNRFFL